MNKFTLNCYVDNILSSTSLEYGLSFVVNFSVHGVTSLDVNHVEDG